MVKIEMDRGLTLDDEMREVVRKHHPLMGGGRRLEKDGIDLFSGSGGEMKERGGMHGMSRLYMNHDKNRDWPSGDTRNVG